MRLRRAPTPTPAQHRHDAQLRVILAHNITLLPTTRACGCASAYSGSDNTSSNGSADGRFAYSGSDNTSPNGSADD